MEDGDVCVGYLAEAEAGGFEDVHLFIEKEGLVFGFWEWWG